MAGEQQRDQQRDDRSRGDDHLSLSQLLFAALGAASTGLQAIDEVADDLAGRVGIDRDKMRTAMRDVVTSWRGEAGRIGGRRDEALERVLERVGVVRRSEIDDLLLRVAQLEHRVQLLEKGEAGG